ncbi:hypothetical protein TREMEDRAFT_73044 [Tremella mesenterica DSM 1558]|uniref:uncharacterized protein n=1 Tax=Tremella mesenterica (strain ATCC 24925 / CBS 8224 / DSM 1558 / NBRC 9311 / NRRL Y-6157 / RJB 2259-6 / UBC 559-6) TaxID=578456 RepID=UPI0003F48DF6|nr:uncharacterized protein TREMEDRAFT_73044 [Tremella mesenterica DSM 1558]EIW73321.1 hypothetical protein TREMEDRAFT_73044 [Tremella mesenterica DSM 1558]
MSATFTNPDHIQPQPPIPPFDPTGPNPTSSNSTQNMPPPQQPQYPTLYNPSANFPLPPNHYPPPGPTQEWYSNYPYHQQYAPRPPQNNAGYDPNSGYPYPPPYPPPMGAQMYQPYPFPPYTQMGDPGPSTMQNGFMPYPGPPLEPGPITFYPQASDSQSHPSSPPHVSPTDTQTGNFDPRNHGPVSPLEQSRSIDNVMVSRSPPTFTPQIPQPGAFQTIHTGHPSQPYPLSYPPNHPYANGAGVGYIPYPNVPMLYPNTNYHPGFMSHMRPPPGPPDPGFKGFNPAAQGFNYNGRRRQTRVNGTVNYDNQPGYPSIRPVMNNRASQVGPPRSWVPPNIPDGERSKSLNPPRPADISTESRVLGLTQMDRPVPPPTDQKSASDRAELPHPPTTVNGTLKEDPGTSTSPVNNIKSTPEAQPDAKLSETDDTPALSLSSSDQPTSPIVQTPTVPIFIDTPNAQSKATVEGPKAEITFGGPILPRIPSPPADQTPRQHILGWARGQVSTRVSTFPQVDPHGQERFGARKTHRKESTVKLEEDVTMASSIPRRAALPIIFGTLEINGEAEQGRKGGADVEERINLVEPLEVPGDVRTPLVKPVKPVSWAALLRQPAPDKPGGGSISGVSIRSDVASKATSPTQSITSLLPDPSVAPSVDQPSPSSTVTSIGIASPPAPIPASRPAPINYAAAAASAAATPQEELVKLLTEGVKGKIPEKGPMTLPRGLINTGNMCFANTILQVLVFCLPFTQLLEELGKRLKADLGRQTPLLEAMIVFLREFNLPDPVPGAAPSQQRNALINGSKHSRRDKDHRSTAFIPEHVYEAMKANKRFDFVQKGHQEDAEEFFGFLNDTLHEEILKLVSRSSNRKISSGQLPNGDTDKHIRRPVSPGAEDSSGWLEVGKKQRVHQVRSVESHESAISRLFGGTLRSVLRVPGNKDSVTLEPFKTLALDIRSDVTTIEDALRHIAEPEIVPGVYSPSRKEKVDASKQVTIETFPPVLVLHLKRFEYDQVEQRVFKRDKPVAYGTELIIPSEVVSPTKRGHPVKYRLFGVDYHHGASSQGGHYTLAAARQDGSGWIHFDDETHSAVPTEAVVVSESEAVSGRAGLIGGREKCAYLLFYQRVR